MKTYIRYVDYQSPAASAGIPRYNTNVTHNPPRTRHGSSSVSSTLGPLDWDHLGNIGLGTADLASILADSD